MKAFEWNEENNQMLMKRPVLSAILDIIFNYKRFYVDFSDIDREEQIIQADHLNLTERNSILTAAGKKIKRKLKSKGNFEFIKMDGLLITGEVNGEKLIISSRTSGTERIIKIIGYGTDIVLISEIIEIIVKAINIT